MARAFGEIAERLRRSTVEVRLRGANAGGSGVIATADGRIVTNAHVARGAGASVRLWDGRELPATLLARDARRDLATLKVEAGGLPAATFGDSGALRVGELVMAIGNPMGFIGALTTGVVHALGSLAGFGRQSWVLADVRLAPGNSGGPLADAYWPRDRHQHHDRERTGRGRSRQCGDGFLAARRVRLLAGRDRAAGAFGRPALRPAGAQGRAGKSGSRRAAVDRRRAHRRWRPAFRSVDDLHQALDDAGGVIHLQFLRGDRAATREVAIRLARPVAEAA
jgi:hypothetical protein